MAEAEAALGRLHKWGGSRLVQEMTAIFAAEAPRRIVELATAVKKSDPESAARAAHSMRSTAGQLGAVELARLAGEIEQRAEARDLAGTSALVEDLEKRLERFLAWLRESAPVSGPAR